MSHPLQPIRDYYLERFRDGIADARGELASVATELLLEIPNRKHLDYCYRLYRADIAGKTDGQTKIREVHVAERAISGWQAILPPRVSVDSPMVWYGIEFEVTGAPPDNPALFDWSSRWIDISDNRYHESAEFQQVVHSVTPPSITESGFSIAVDFGSAPTAAFDELTELLTRDGRRVSVGSFFLFRSTK